MMADGIHKNHVIIINGDNEARHTENVQSAINAFREENTGSLPIDISVASAGKVTGADHFYKANAQGIEQMIEDIRKNSDEDDNICVYITGHGSKTKDNKPSIALINGTTQTFEDFQQKLDLIPYGERVVISDLCLGGSSISLFANDKTTLVSAGSAGEETECQKFSPLFWAAVKTVDENKDGLATVQERFAYATSSLTTDDFIPLYYSPVGPETTLMGQTEKAFPFKPEVIDCESEQELQA